LGGEAESGAPSDVGIEMASLPPQWVDAAEEAREDIARIREKLVQLGKAHNRRLLKVFSDDGAPDKEVEGISSAVAALIRRCESQIHQVKTIGHGAGAPPPSDLDREFRKNVQRSLATQLQQLSQQFRQAQKQYLGEIRKRQKGALWDDGPSTSGGGGGGSSDIGFSEGQLLELDQMESTASQRSEEICQIASSINDLHTIFKELAVLVIDQGSILDRIDYNIEQVVHQSKEANVQLEKAEKSAKSNRATKCMLILVAINVVLILILIFRSWHSS